MKIIEQNPSNFIPELSPNWNPKSGMLEFDNITITIKYYLLENYRRIHSYITIEESYIYDVYVILVLQ